jgi:hypothetical protein
MTVCLHLADSMAEPDGSSRPQEITLDKLQSCRDVYNREKNASYIVNELVTTLRESQDPVGRTRAAVGVSTSCIYGQITT